MLPAEAPLAVLQLSSSGLVVRGDGNLERILGMPTAAVVGRSLAGLPVQGEADRHGLLALIQACQEGRSWAGVLVVQQDGGPARGLLLELVPADAGGGGLVWVMRCPPNALEERLLATRHEGQRELILNLSHNLNNILTGVLAPAQLLLEDLHHPDAQQDLQDILASTLRARALLLELKQAVQVEATPAEPLALAPVIASAQEDLGPLLAESGVTMKVLAPPADAGEIAVQAQGETLVVILRQILCNAVEAGPRSGRILLALLAESDDVLIEVRDDGEGMSPEALRRVFEPLFSTKAVVGSDLSLSSARAQLRHWGGDLVLESALGQGTVARIRLRRATLAVVAPPRRGRVLIVEDDPLIARAIQRLLGRENDVTVSLSGLSTLQSFVPDAFDVALVDLTMPELSGEALARALRRIDPPLSLLLTGWLIQPDDPLMTVFDGLLQKPVTDLARARERVRRAVQGTRARRSTPTEPGTSQADTPLSV